jgi:hypothetical protein
MAKRIFVEKKAGFVVKATSLKAELQHRLQVDSLTDLRLVQVYDVFGLTDEVLSKPTAPNTRTTKTTTIIATILRGRRICFSKFMYNII